MYAETLVIYADILFLINFSVDFLCLFISGRLLGRSFRAVRMILASVFASLYSFLPYLLDMSGASFIPLHILAAIAAVLIAYGFAGIKKLLLHSLTFIATEALIGGLVTAIYSVTARYSDGIYADVSALSLALALGVSAAAALLYGLICRKKVRLRAVRARILYNGERTGVDLLVDSGNLVSEPFSALPVIVLSSTVLPPPFDRPDPESYPLPLRAIPFNTSSGRSCMYGFMPDGIELCPLGKKPQRVEAYIGIDVNTKSFSGYDGLLPGCLIQ